MFTRFRKSRPLPAIPAGERVYAIGDIHGRRDLFDRLIAAIDADDAARGPAATTLILLGDLIDRGPDSAGVVQRAIDLATARPAVRVIAGNHEELLLRTLDGDEKATKVFCRAGGRETVLSYGIAPSDYEAMSHEEVTEALLRVMPATHRDFVATMDDLVVIGDYAFVHAGVRPGVPLADQTTADLRWIREPFLTHRGDLGHVVVHGHTIRPTVEFLPHRIGLDTGAYASGRLTALGLEGADRWTLDTAG